MPQTTFLEEEDKRLVQLARSYADQGVPVAWREVAKKMRRWQRKPKELEQRLNSLKRTFGTNLAAFPPSFFTLVQCKRGRRSSLVQQIRHPSSVSFGQSKRLRLATSHFPAPDVVTETSTQPAQAVDRQPRHVSVELTTTATTITEPVDALLLAEQDTLILTSEPTVNLSSLVVESELEPLTSENIFPACRKVLSPCSAARAVWATFDRIPRKTVAYPPSAPHLNAGELLPPAVSQLISAICSINPITRHDIFLDIGCGVGNVLAQFALETTIGASIGIEIRQELVQQGRQAIASYSSRWSELTKLQIFPGDVCQLELSVTKPFSSATIVFANNVRFEQTANNHIYDELFFMLDAWSVVLTNEVCPRHNRTCAKTFCCRWGLKQVLVVPVSWTKQANVYIYTEII